MTAVLAVHVRVFSGGRELQGKEREEAFALIKFLRASSGWDGNLPKSEEQQEKEAKEAADKFELLKSLEFEDTRTPPTKLHWQDVIFDLRRPITAEDLRRMNVPVEFRGNYQLSGAFAEPLRQYIKNLDTVRRDGIGIYLYGPASSGKTRAAAAVLKTVATYGRLGYFTIVSDLRELIRNRMEFDGGLLAVEMCKRVEFLVLDNVRPMTDSREVFLPMSMIEDIVHSRKLWKKPTILTSRSLPGELSRDLKLLVDSSCLLLQEVKVWEQKHVQEDIKTKLGVK